MIALQGPDHVFLSNSMFVLKTFTVEKPVVLKTFIVEKPVSEIG